MNIKICILGSFGYKDIGDEAMLTEDLRYLVDELDIPKENITLFGDLTDYLSNYHNHPIAQCRPSRDLLWNALIFGFNLKRLLQSGMIIPLVKHAVKRRSLYFRRSAKVVNECDFLLVTGGGTINTRDPSGKSLKRMHALLSYFWDNKKPVFISAQTIGPLGINSTHDQMAREIVEKAEFIACRDNRYSRRYAKVIGTDSEKLYETYDDAYTLDFDSIRLEHELEEFLAKGPCAAMNVTEYTGEKVAHQIHFASLVENVVEKHNFNVVLVSHTPADFKNLWIIWDMLKENIKARVTVPDIRHSTGGYLKKIISQCVIAIGGRYHFIVFAGTAGVPFVGLCGNHYSYIKQDGFARMLGEQEYILNERVAFDREYVCSVIAKRIKTPYQLAKDFSFPGAAMRKLGDWISSKNFCN